MGLCLPSSHVRQSSNRKLFPVGQVSLNRRLLFEATLRLWPSRSTISTSTTSFDLVLANRTPTPCTTMAQLPSKLLDAFVALAGVADLEPMLARLFGPTDGAAEEPHGPR